MLKQAMGVSHAKVILIGEHSVVYQKPAIALPLPAVKTTAIIRALYQAFGQPLTHEQLRADADISEHIIHGNPSGLDVATTSADAAVWFHKGEDPVDLPFHLTSYLVVADSGIHGQTGLAVKHVADFKEAHNRLATHAINHLGALTEAAKDALLKNDVLHLIALAKTAKDAAKITTALKQMNILETWTQPFLSEEVVYDDAN